MASTETRPSFRLPWNAGPAGSGAPSESPAQSPEDPTEASIDSGGMPETEETQTSDKIETVAPAETPARPEPPDVAPGRRATKFMAELSHAMLAAAEHARNETMERFAAEAERGDPHQVGR